MENTIGKADIPIPCMLREIIINDISVENAPPITPNVYTPNVYITIIVSRTFFLPWVSEIFPAIGTDIAPEIKYADNIHEDVLYGYIKITYKMRKSGHQHSLSI